MPPRVRLTSDGRVKVKVPGRKSRVFKVPFLDTCRSRAFRNLRYVLNQLDFKIIGEEVVKRNLDVRLEGNPMKVQVKDRILLALLAPTPKLVKNHPALTKPAYTIPFIYSGGGRFDVAFTYDEKEEYEAFGDFFGKLLKLYMGAFLNDTALKKETTLEKKRTQLFPREIEDGEMLKTPVVEVKPQKKIKPKLVRPKKSVRRKKSEPDSIKTVEPTIEYVKERISSYRPKSFKEKLALKRYREALAASPDKEEGIHRLFHSLINGENDLQNFYYQLYSLAPKLIERLELP